MDFKELFALQPGSPIISLGAAPIYHYFDLPADAPINEEQQKYIIKKEPPAVEVAAEPKRELTKAERARERRQANIRAREERRAHYQQEREVEHAEQMRLRAQPDPAAVVAVAAAHDAVIVRANAFVQAARAAPVHQGLDNPAVVAAVDAVDPGTRRTKFWAIIARLNWHNASDGAMPAGPVTAIFNALSLIDTLIFKREYEGMFNGMIEFLRADGMFDRNGAADYRAQAKIVSHVIALGEDQYITLIGDPMIMQFLVEMGECQSLNDLLPENVRM